MDSHENFLGEMETIIVGGGQAGLSVGRYLKEHNKSFLILEKTNSIGSSWRKRYDSMQLDSFAKYSHLEGFPFQGDLMRHTKKEEVADYLQSFAKHHNIIPQFSTEVYKIEKEKNKFIVYTNKGVYRAKFVVLATGPFQKAYIPKNIENIPQNIYQIHSKDYRNPSQLKEGITLVVGAGNSGAEIVEELIESGRVVLFSYKRKFKSIKSNYFSQWLAYRLGLAHVPKDSLLGRIIIWYTKGKPVGVDVKKLLKNPNLTSAPEFKGEVPKNISNIIWATGYESDFSVISIPDFNPLTQIRGVTNIPNLFILNIRWQYSKSSSHLAGVSRDAKYIAKCIINTIHL
ncbi:hypothetical protein A2641_03535 [Candidatus Nomurabacteria bacterium RIFCSPHIGHO2_01_FULL_37_25]|uniref:FAD-dependent oxidoreductase n=1 Tax=Candidatus Nomurabacteria bacterium RIFCSPLOWO2_01_FULL_36_16 TaxID=1801767 RepID=A0A1F6WZS1_9BACT|nr:MAG: hypothetical protein A2641_03535 [Candidatus Nomurabacteria bacterium RIFCSPHIGHO2_01_FULL_37_25]OGI75561.1 MAG: hypothetical protein A3D36_03180 [Candidatus Nomurabacteria bacterium RIFCSPHIGHO2_02_FULL_36_29]OGI87399.1 MAG: hypothetical protein A3A91_02800 [Candidatus Nomurabacteria bacterium RIFCSPLOWO2_01_FULL_36_16]